MNDRWDLSFLYKGFDDETFRRDLGSLEGETKKLQAILDDESLPPKERLEKYLDAEEAFSARVDALANFIMCTQAVDATNEAADAANDQLMNAFTAMELLSSALTRYVAGLEDLEGVIASSPKLQAVAFALREMQDSAKHLLPPAAEPWMLEMQLSGGNAFSQLRDKLDSTLSVDYRDEHLPLAAVRGKAYDPDPAVRRDAYEAELAAYPKMDLPMSYCLNSIKLEARTLAKARGFDSVLDMNRLLCKEDGTLRFTGDKSCPAVPLGMNGTILDLQMVNAAQKALEHKEEVTLDYAIRNTDRAVGAMLSGVVAKRYGNAGLPDDTISVKFKGAAGQSFGAFLTHGITFKLEGETNDYFAKGLSGGRIAILPPTRSSFKAEDNIIAGNTGLYGATSGELYINGKVGERFGVRNSGAIAVIEGAGDHCCEYMTGGRVVVLGETGRNFAAGMSGGVAYVWDRNHNFDYFCNMDMVEINLVEDSVSRKELLELIRQHYLHTGSALAGKMLDNWAHYCEEFIQVLPIEYKRVLQEEQMKKLRDKIADMQREF